MNIEYNWLSSCCNYGWVDVVRRMIKESEVKGGYIDIFWIEIELIHMDVSWGGAKVLKILIDYYEERQLQGDQESCKGDA